MTEIPQEAELFLKFLDELNQKYATDDIIYDVLKKVAFTYHQQKGIEAFMCEKFEFLKVLKRKARKQLTAILKRVASEEPRFSPIVDFLFREKITFEYMCATYVYEYYYTHIAISRIIMGIKNSEIKSANKNI